MSGKQKKREIKQAKLAAREAARRRERARTIQTGIVIAIAVALGGVIIFASLQNPDADVALDDTASELPSELASDLPSDLASEGPSEGPSDVASEPAAPPVPACQPPGPAANAGQEKPTFEAPEQGQIAPDRGYRARIDTTCGVIVVDLAEEDAPETVNSFVFLARSGFFNGLEIFRNSPGISIVQTGAGTNQNDFSIGYTIPDELARAEALGYPAGSIAMANSGPGGTGGSQFFLVYGDSQLPPQYTNFGGVVEGLDVLRSIGAIPNEDGTETPTTPAYINSIQIEEFPEPEPPAPNTPAGGGAPTAAEAPTSEAPAAAPSESGG